MVLPPPPFPALPAVAIIVKRDTDEAAALPFPTVPLRPPQPSAGVDRLRAATKLRPRSRSVPSPPPPPPAVAVRECR